MFIDSNNNHYSIEQKYCWFANNKLTIVYSIIFTLMFLTSHVVAQYSVIGQFPKLKGQNIRLMGFSGLTEYDIDSSFVSETGVFKLKYSSNDIGIGYISDIENKSYIIILENGGVELKGETIGSPETIEIIKGLENIIFTNYFIQHAKREQILSTWNYLQRIYKNDSLFSSQHTMNQSIVSEMNRIEKQDFDYLSELPNTSYIYWYLTLRKLISSASKVIQYGPDEITSTINLYRNINYNDPRLHKSGLYKDAIQSHFWLLENRGWLSLDSIYKDMNVSSNLILKTVETNPTLFNELSKFLFEYFEKHSLFEASEYLALNILNQSKIKINPSLANQLESYRSLKVGNTASEIIFIEDIIKDGSKIKSPLTLSEIISDYKLVIFGASWCSSCTEEIKNMLPLYSKWQTKNMEVIFISLDTDRNAFNNYVNQMPFISTCDYKKWDTKAAKDYFISSSPTLFLLDKHNKILLRPKSISAVDAWVDYNIHTIE